MPEKHVGALAVSREQQAELAASFVHKGLVLGRRAMFVGLHDETRHFERRLREDGVDTVAGLRSGDLVLAADDPARARLGLSDQHLAHGLGPMINTAVRDGYTGVCVVAASLPQNLAGHRAAFEPLLADDTLMFLCLYDEAALSPDSVAAVQAAHEAVLVRPALLDDGLLRITSTGYGRIRLAGEVDMSNRDAMADVVEKVRVGTDGAVLEVDAASLRFIDPGGVRLLIAAARSKPPVRLQRTQPTVRRIVALIDRDGSLLPPEEAGRDDRD